ncbi:MAG: tRNA epoxyqueuosine(34) reductase QueG [Rikenellaceae bacterium]
MLKSNIIKESATVAGFDLVGITFPREFDSNRTAYLKWLESGSAENIAYMQKYLDQRFNPANLLDNTRSIVVCALNYKNIYSINTNENREPKIASYALNRDYHKIIRKQLKELLKSLQSIDPSIKGRACVDTAPLLEKQLAVEAGLGWIGRQSLLITPQFGSFVHIGVLLLTTEVDAFDSPLEHVGCGECRRCIDACPNGAISETRTIDSRRCISALTVECENPEQQSLHDWIFGCDECQSICPYNRNTPLSRNPAIQPIFAPISAKKWRTMSSEEFTERLGSTPLKRGGLARLQRNCKEE